MVQGLKRLELDTVMRSVANVVKMYVTSAVEPIVERIARLEARKPEKGEPGLDGKSGPAGPAGRDGKDGSDGRDGEKGESGTDGAPGESGPIGPQGLPGRDGRDGVAGPSGKDGLNGKDGRDGIDGKDGAAGLSGKDGLGFDDLTCSLEDGGRVLVLKFVCGERVKEFRLTTATMIYRGVFVDGNTYEHGDTVTWGGSLFHCNEETKAKPNYGEKAWTLAAKRGNDGNNGLPGAKGERGPQGLPGRDRTV